MTAACMPAPGTAPLNLSGYPWLYLRDGVPPKAGEPLVELITAGDVMLGRFINVVMRDGKVLAIGATLVLGPAVVLACAWWFSGLLWADALVVGRTIAVEQAMVALNGSPTWRIAQAIARVRIRALIEQRGGRCD